MDRSGPGALGLHGQVERQRDFTGTAFLREHRDGFHVVYPQVCMSTGVQVYKATRESVAESLRRCQHFLCRKKPRQRLPGLVVS
jgi:hypothetical protein